MVITSEKQDVFNFKGNKQKFINVLANRLQFAGCTIANTTAITDLLVAQTAVAFAKTKNSSGW